MLHRHKIISIDDPLFGFAWDLYVASFPAEERRAIDYQSETLGCALYNADVVLDCGEPIGILFWWDLPKFTYIEHLATSPAVRGQGYGDKVLREVIERSDKPIILEVEYPQDEISRRRIGFYERIGFKLSPLPYSHPSYNQPSDERVELMIMSYPQAINAEQLAGFSAEELPLIHFRAFE